MSVRLLNAQQVSKLLPVLFNKHDEISVAAAWGANGSFAKELFAHKHKFRSVTFGVAFCQTDPDLIDQLVDQPNAFIAESGSGTFHPKIYYFRSGDKAEAVIGSSNFTFGGLGANWEANVHVEGPAKAKVFKDIRATLKDYVKLQKSVTPEIAARYRLQFNAAKSLKKPQNPVLSSASASFDQLASQLANMNWDDYVRAVKRGKFHNFSERLALLRECQRMLASVSTFSDLSPNEWKAIAGVIGEVQKHEAGLTMHDWGWFGSMKGMGDFANRVADQDQYLAAALDVIPRHGVVDEPQYDEFCENFLLAFRNSHRTGNYPTATRLLAMKRPDVFVCISKPNLEGLSNALGFSKSTLTLKNYWQRVVEPVRMSPWFNAPRPKGKEAELWDGRVAMLDAIYYNP